jgi:hypothetical protein
VWNEQEGCMTWGGSFTHQPEALGAVQKIIKNIDSQKDIQNWILSNRCALNFIIFYILLL